MLIKPFLVESKGSPERWFSCEPITEAKNKSEAKLWITTQKDFEHFEDAFKGKAKRMLYGAEYQYQSLLLSSAPSEEYPMLDAVGLMLIETVVGCSEHSAHLQYIYILPKYRSKGIAYAWLSKLMLWCEGINIHTWYSEHSAGNRYASKLYASLGFTEMFKHPFHYDFDELNSFDTQREGVYLRKGL